jgi:hypothetical protein
LRPEIGILGTEAPLLERFLQHMQKLVELERLLDEVRRSALHDVDRVFERSVARDHDRDDAGIAFPCRLNDPCPVDSRQPEVGDHHVEGELIQELEGPLAAVSLGGVEAAFAQTLGHQRAERGFVVDE